MEIDPYSLFLIAMNSPQTKEKYVTRLNRFFDYIGVKKNTMKIRCKEFVDRSRSQSNGKYAINSIISFLQMNKDRVQRKEITGATVRNYVKTIKLFCEVNDILLPWKRITKGLPKARRYAEDRAPTLEEIRKLTEYPDRRIKAIVYTMASSGIRLGAWDLLRWKHVTPIKRNEKTVAAKLTVYPGDPEEYFTFITPEAYFELEKWMNYRMDYGEEITGEPM
jgi:integrase